MYIYLSIYLHHPNFQKKKKLNSFNIHISKNKIYRVVKSSKGYPIGRRKKIKDWSTFPLKEVCFAC